MRVQIELLRVREQVRQSVWNRIMFRRHYAEYLAVQIGSSAYSRQHAAAGSGTEKSVRRLMNCLEPGPVVLDAGCGDGYALDLLRSAGYTAIGIDVNFDKLQEARHHGNELVVLADLHHIPISPDCVDAIHCSHVLEHTLDGRRALAELRRVLKLGGKVLFVLPLGPANYKHPTAFLDERDVHRMIGPYFLIEELGVGEGRGGREVSVVVKKTGRLRLREQ